MTFSLIFLFVIFLWLFTSIPLFASGLLGVSLSVLFGIVSAKTAFAPFADPIIFLFLGGFLLGQGLEKTKLDQYFAHKILAHKKISSSAQNMMIAFLALIFIFSMWISNTAAVAMFIPLGLGLLKKIKIEDPKLRSSFLISMAYAATIGGNVTPIGSPPNVVAIGFLRNLTGVNVSFLKWMMIATPISLILLAFVIRNLLKNAKDVNLPTSLETETEVEEYRITSPEQKYVSIIFALTVFFWISPSIIQVFISKESDLSLFLSTNLTAANVAIFFSSLLFLFPIFGKDKILKAKDLSQVDWSSLLLFGSGLSLGNILFKSGMASEIADVITGSGLGSSFVLLMFVLLFVTIFFTELASNTASANILIPIIIATCKQLGVSPTMPTLMLAMACNCAFMLPVGTPPNAIVYGTGHIEKIDMIKLGFRVNLLGWALLSIGVLSVYILS